jgi:uncharacterized membrane protein
MNADAQPPREHHFRAFTFRRAVLRGLGVVLPPLLTIVVLIWAWKTIEIYVLRPIESGIRHAIVLSVEETYSEVPVDAMPLSIGTPRLNGFIHQGTTFVPVQNNRRFIPDYVKKLVEERSEYFGPYTPAPASANAYWHRYVELEYMPRWIVVPVFLVVFATALYFLGRLFTFGLGRWMVVAFDHAILRIPVISKVYGGVKQVTDFVFSEREIEFNRVIAVQYPREGIWSLGFVTGVGMSEIAEATGEPMLSVLMPTSPMPMTGFTITVKKSEAIDLRLTIDEAIQFIVSCGVVLPLHQRGGAIDVLAAKGVKPKGASPPGLTSRGDEPGRHTPQTQL